MICCDFIVGSIVKVYKNALKFEFEQNGFKVESQKEIDVFYKSINVGKYFADLVVDDKIIIELKCCNKVLPIHKAQLLNYLRATGFKLGIIINFPNDSKGFEIERIPNIKN